MALDGHNSLVRPEKAKSVEHPSCLTLDGFSPHSCPTIRTVEVATGHGVTLWAGWSGCRAGVWLAGRVWLN
jgi:hypothetical protein